MTVDTITLWAGSGPRPWWAYQDDYTGRGAQLFAPFDDESEWTVMTHEGFRDPPKLQGFVMRADAEFAISEWLASKVQFEAHHTERLPA